MRHSHNSCSLGNLRVSSAGETSSGNGISKSQHRSKGHCWTSNSFQAQIMQIHANPSIKESHSRTRSWCSTEWIDNTFNTQTMLQHGATAVKVLRFMSSPGLIDSWHLCSHSTHGWAATNWTSGHNSQIQANVKTKATFIRALAFGIQDGGFPVQPAGLSSQIVEFYIYSISTARGGGGSFPP